MINILNHINNRPPVDSSPHYRYGRRYFNPDSIRQTHAFSVILWGRYSVYSYNPDCILPDMTFNSIRVHYD